MSENLSFDFYTFDEFFISILGQECFDLIISSIPIIISIISIILMILAILYAKFPRSLVKLCLLAGCPEGGKVLDPFSGSGTTGKVAVELGCEYTGIELNPVYAVSSEKKIKANKDNEIRN